MKRLVNLMLTLRRCSRLVVYRMAQKSRVLASRQESHITSPTGKLGD